KPLFTRVHRRLPAPRPCPPWELSPAIPTSLCDRGRVGDPPGAVRRRTRRRLPGGHALAPWGGSYGQLQMPEELPAPLALRDGRDAPQPPPLTPGAARQSEGKDALAPPACPPGPPRPVGMAWGSSPHAGGCVVPDSPRAHPGD